MPLEGTLRVIIISVIGLLAMVQTANASIIDVQCISKSGQSVYNIYINTEDQSGLIRYRFMGQDVLYDVILNSKSTDVIVGVAEFKESRSGEKRGNPFTFKYDANSKIFEDLNVVASCE